VTSKDTKTHTVPEKRLFTVKESAKYMGHSDWGMRSLIWAKKIPVVRYGRKQFVDIYDLDKFIKDNKTA
jgi:excisionase family DNA binding protein